MDHPPGRKTLPHQPPPWVDPDASNYFITICCQQRRNNQLCLSETAAALLSSARFYCEQRQWHSSLFLLMPDHLHMLASFGREQKMGRVIRAWKRFTAKECGIAWQRDFFEHRLRSQESIEEKAAYILQNPVRGGLVADASAWSWVWIPD